MPVLLKFVSVVQDVLEQGIISPISEKCNSQRHWGFQFPTPCAVQNSMVYVSGEGFAQLIAVGHFREDTKFLLHGQCPESCRKLSVVNLSWL